MIKKVLCLSLLVASFSKAELTEKALPFLQEAYALCAKGYGEEVEKNRSLIYERLFQARALCLASAVKNGMNTAASEDDIKRCLYLVKEMRKFCPLPLVVG